MPDVLRRLRSSAAAGRWQSSSSSSAASTTSSLSSNHRAALASPYSRRRRQHDSERRRHGSTMSPGGSNAESIFRTRPSPQPASPDDDKSTRSVLRGKLLLKPFRSSRSSMRSMFPMLKRRTSSAAALRTKEAGEDVEGESQRCFDASTKRDREDYDYDADETNTHEDEYFFYEESDAKDNAEEELDDDHDEDDGDTLSPLPWGVSSSMTPPSSGSSSRTFHPMTVTELRQDASPTSMDAISPFPVEASRIHRRRSPAFVGPGTTGLDRYDAEHHGDVLVSNVPSMDDVGLPRRSSSRSQDQHDMEVLSLRDELRCQKVRSMLTVARLQLALDGVREDADAWREKCHSLQRSNVVLRMEGTSRQRRIDDLERALEEYLELGVEAEESEAVETPTTAEVSKAPQRKNFQHTRTASTETDKTAMTMDMSLPAL